MAEQATKDWEPVLNMMHDYKGLVTSWKDILGLYNSMADKHKVDKLISFFKQSVTQEPFLEVFFCISDSLELFFFGKITIQNCALQLTYG